MTHTFNNGTLTVNADTIAYKKLLSSSTTIQRNRISSITYQYDNIIYKLLRFPLGILYCLLIVTIATGIRCLRGDVIAYIKMTNGESHQFWIYGNEFKQFKSIL